MPEINTENEKNTIKLALKRNIRLIYAMAFFHAFMLIAPVLVPFFESKGLTIAQIFYLQAIFAGTIMLLEAPSGYLADKFGRRSVLLAGSAAHGLGSLCLVFADGFFGLVLFEFVLGIAASMMSGADLALLYDSEQALNDTEGEHSNSIAHLTSTKALAAGSGALLGGALALWSFDAILLAQAALAWVCLVLALMITEPPNTPEHETETALNFKGIFRHIFKGDKLLRQVFFAIPLYNLSTFQVVWLIQPYWQERGLSLLMFGVLWFAQNLTVGFASHFGAAVEKHKGAVFALLLMGVLPIAAHFGMAWFNGWYGITLCFVVFFCRGLYQVTLVNALNKRVPGSVRATVNSLTSLTFRFGFVLTGPVLGHIAQTRGLSTALNMLGFSSLLMFLLIMLPLVRAVKKMQTNIVLTKPLQP